MIPPRLSALFPSERFSPRQRSLLARLLSGEEVALGDLNGLDKDTAWRLQGRGIIDFAPATCRLILTRPVVAPPPEVPFVDGSRATLRAGRWIVGKPSSPGMASLGCLAADWAAAANAVRAPANS